MSSTLLISRPVPVKPSYHIPDRIKKLRSNQIEFQRLLEAPLEEYRAGYWAGSTTRCCFCPSEVKDPRRAYRGKVCGLCEEIYGLKWPGVPTLRERCQHCRAPFGQGERQGRWTAYVIDEFYRPGSPQLCPPCWRRARFPRVADYLAYVLNDHTIKQMRWNVAWALHACRESQRVQSDAMENFGSVRNRAIADATDEGWLNPILCELIRFGDVVPRDAAIVFLSAAKRLVDEIEQMSIAEQREILQLEIDEEPEIDRLAGLDEAGHE